MTFGFIILRHVNSEKTNKYWNESVRCIRKLYPFKKIVVIDDNSKQEFVKPDFEYTNVQYIQSEFPQRGEILPYYYFHKHRFFDNAIIIHDSVFIQLRFNFDLFNKIKVLPLWHFSGSRDENYTNSLHLTRVLKNNYKIQENLKGAKTKEFVTLGMNNTTNWYGCFGVQTYINYEFLNYIQTKYNVFNLLKVVKNRTDRCCLERIMGVIFSLECPELNYLHSLLGSIQHYSKGEYSWGYTYEQHRRFVDKYNKSIVPYVKVWTGR